MGYSSSASNTAAASSNSKGYEEAQGFVNLVLELPGQMPVKLPSLPIHVAKHSQELLDWLSADSANASKLLQYIKADFKLNVKTAKVLDFSKL